MRRVEATVEVELVTSAGSRAQGRLVDLGVLGLRMSAPDRLPVGTSCSVRIRTHEPGNEIDARGRVARLEEGFVAVRFDELPYESYERLRAFLLGCADDPSALDDELSDGMGFLVEGT